MTRNYAKKNYADGGSVKDDKSPILQPRDYYGGFESPAQTYLDALVRTRDMSPEQSKDVARHVALAQAKRHRIPTGDEEGYAGYKKGGVVKKKKK